MAEVKCPKCGAANPEGAAKCGCGESLAVAPGAPPPTQESMYGFDMANRPPIAWDWTAMGFVVLLGLQFLLNFTLAPYLVSTFIAVRTPNPVVFWTLTLGIAVAIYFAVGFVLGRYSKGYLVREPPIAAATASAVAWLLEHFVFKKIGAGVGMLIVSILICAVAGYVGGVTGENVQQRRREERQAAGKR